ncbi:uncharacterized protein DUF202 [Hasllibacter halocynthiae]|uniref:Uncharacterized protein DUF202 n=1 Tax=Hasllibacter halocynthiae TaxID=595589 RepID=A0A2T0X676_9RHOB|nr:DUF202 domain-containing protein [Hasllibacter halocynthiae]PRY94427.1 uncharacterized protein DUF202 [Hasllibacter halocynthiae]
MAPSYLTRSRLAWLGIALLLGGFAVTAVAGAFGLPPWAVPVGYFVALAGSGVLFVGWLRWKAAHPRR